MSDTKWDWRDALEQERDRLRAERDELLEACKAMLSMLDGTRGRRWEGEYADSVRALIAKAEGEESK